MKQLPYSITPELTITACKPISRMRFSVKFSYQQRIEAEAIYAWGNSRYTSLGVQCSITDTNAMEIMDELIEDNHLAIREFLQEQETIIKTS